MSNIDIEKIELAAAEELDARTKNRTYSTFIEPADVMELVGRLRAAERERDEISRDYDLEHYHRLAIERSEQALAAHVERFNSLMDELAGELDGGDECDSDPLLSKLWSLRRSAPKTSLARHDGDVIASLRFPTMLRKMWSGGEVQQWLDDQAAEKRCRAEVQS